MIRSELTMVKAASSPGRPRKVFHSVSNTLVGIVFEDRGKGAGFKYQLKGRDHASSERFKTAKAACIALGAKL